MVAAAQSSSRERGSHWRGARSASVCNRRAQRALQPVDPPMKPRLNLGAWRQLNGAEGGDALWLPAEHLVTHGVVVGMTGSGKTGLVTVMIEEAARAQVPTVVIDVKGDLPNLLLAFPGFEPAAHAPWVELDSEEQREGPNPELLAARARELADKRRAALAEGQIGEPELAAYCAGTAVRVLTPGGTAGGTGRVRRAGLLLAVRRSTTGRAPKLRAPGDVPASRRTRLTAKPASLSPDGCCRDDDVQSRGHARRVSMPQPLNAQLLSGCGSKLQM